MAFALTGKFESFDSLAGFLITQIILSSAAFWAGFKQGVSAALVLVVGGYLGINAYAYVFGGSEHRVWALLGLISTLILVLFPAVAAVSGGIVRLALSKFRQRKTGKAKNNGGQLTVTDQS